MQTFAWDIWMTCRWEEEWKKSNKTWPRSLTWRLSWVFDLTAASANIIQKQNGQRRLSGSFSEWTMNRYFCLGPQYSRVERCRWLVTLEPLRHTGSGNTGYGGLSGTKCDDFAAVMLRSGQADLCPTHNPCWDDLLLQKMDNQLRSGLEKILNVELDDVQWKQAILIVFLLEMEVWELGRCRCWLLLHILRQLHPPNHSGQPFSEWKTGTTSTRTRFCRLEVQLYPWGMHRL